LKNDGVRQWTRLSHISTGWWLTYPSEKYEFVSWDDDIPNTWKIKIHVPNHQPDNNNKTKPSPVTADLPLFGDFGTSQTIYIFWKSPPRKNKWFQNWNHIF